MRTSFRGYGVVAACAFAVVVRAQSDSPRLFLGVVAGYAADFHSGSFVMPPVYNNSFSFNSGTGRGSIAGIAGEYLLNDGGFALRFACDYETMPGSFSKPLDSYPWYDLTTGGISVFTPSPTVKTTYDLFSVEAALRYDVFQNLGITIGPELGFVSARSFSYSGNVPVFTGNSDSLQYDTLSFPSFDTSGTISNANKLRFAVAVGLQYELRYRNFLVVPGISYNLALTNVRNDYAWSVSSLAGTMAVMWGF